MGTPTRFAASLSGPMIQLEAIFGMGRMPHHRLEEVGELARRGEEAGVVGGKIVLPQKAAPPNPGQLGKRVANSGQLLARHDQGRKVRIGKIAVVPALFLGPHRADLPPHLIPEQRQRFHRAALRDDPGLSLDLEPERLPQTGEGVEILDLRLPPRSAGAGRTDRHVRIHAQASLFHVAVAHVEVFEHPLELLQELPRFGRAAQMGLRHDLDQRKPGAVQLDGGPPAEAVVKGPARILLQVKALDPDGASILPIGRVEATPAGQRTFELGDLVSLGEVGVEVVLPREDAPFVNRAPEAQRRP